MAAAVVAVDAVIERCVDVVLEWCVSRTLVDVKVIVEVIDVMVMLIMMRVCSGAMLTFYTT
jgi:hypothetical protein